jgi:hypothetical protein
MFQWGDVREGNILVLLKRGEESSKFPIANFCFTFFLLFLNNSVILWQLKTEFFLEVFNFRLELLFFKEILFLGPQTKILAWGKFV